MLNEKRLYALAVLLAGLLLFANLPIFKKFTISDQSAGKTVYIRDLSRTESFCITFIHSVNRTPVEEYYRVSDDKFIVYKTVFESYGAGMPDSTDLSLDGSKITIQNLNIELQSFNIFVGTIASHKIDFEDKSFSLASLAPAKSSLMFDIKRVSLCQMILIDYN